MDFVAIDFETANDNYDSACSIGIAAVQDKKIVETQYYLIQPPSLDFNEINIEINGIRPEDVKDAPPFPEIWNKIMHYFSDNIIIAHNAVFDMSVLKNCLTEYNLPIPNFDYLCSIPISTCACRGENVGRSLEERTKYFGISIGNHHNSLDDAVACANLVIESINRVHRKSFESFCNTYTNLPIKHFSDLNPKKGFMNNGKKSFERIAIHEIVATKSDFDKSNIFYGKNVVFTGELKSMERKEAMQKVVNLGAILKSGVSSKTDYLVVGVQDKSLVGDDGMSTKEKNAYKLIKEKGCNIKIINEDEFLTLI